MWKLHSSMRRWTWRILMVQPPPFLVEKLVDRHTLFMPTKALYSPQGTGLSIGMEFSNPRALAQRSLRWRRRSYWYPPPHRPLLAQATWPSNHPRDQPCVWCLQASSGGHVWTMPTDEDRRISWIWHGDFQARGICSKPPSSWMFNLPAADPCRPMPTWFSSHAFMGHFTEDVQGEHWLPTGTLSCVPQLGFVVFSDEMSGICLFGRAKKGLILVGKPFVLYVYHRLGSMCDPTLVEKKFVPLGWWFLGFVVKSSRFQWHNLLY